MTSQLSITCERHGVSQYCLICRHLRDQAGLGFYEIEAEPGEPAQAWCETCDQALRADRGWSDRADEIAAWALFCTACYDETLEQHHLLSLVEGTRPDE